ncbi:MAG: type II toxin-antitoxin system RelE family toxin [Terriglobia bacterium]
MQLQVKITGTPFKYLQSLDKPTRNRIVEKLKEIANDPLNSRLSYPLVSSTKRSSRVGKYRILFQVDDKVLEVADIGPRGQIYRKA